MNCWRLEGDCLSHIVCGPKPFGKLAMPYSLELLRSRRNSFVRKPDKITQRFYILLGNSWLRVFVHLPYFVTLPLVLAYPLLR